MSLTLRPAVAFAAVISLSVPTFASIVQPSAPGEQLSKAAAVFRGTVLCTHTFQDPSDQRIYTAAYIRAEETFKGTLPAIVKLVHRGGVLAGRGESDGFAPQFIPGEERLLFVARRPDGSLFARLGTASALRLNGGREKGFAERLLTELRQNAAGGTLAGEDLYEQGVSVAQLAAISARAPAAFGPPPPSFIPHSDATNLMVGSDAIPARFITPDRGEAIPYYVDADYLPAGVTLAQALDAVSAALAAWTNASSVRFKFSGIQSFGMAAPNLPVSDEALRIQLHDAYGFLPGAGELLGQGGRSWSIQNLSPGWTLGGNVQGNDFHKVTKGYVVMRHTAAFLQNISNLKEVLCHEIGHAIGLAHSSENPNETNPVLKDAIMYYLAHGNGRGATLADFDVNTCQQIHPKFNTPPFTFDRVLEVVTTPDPQSFSVPGVNTVFVPAYDLQDGLLSVDTADPSTPNGVFSLSASILSYVPAAFYGEGFGSFDFIYTRCSDGPNASPYAKVQVVAFRPDDYSEGIPNSWRLAYFGAQDPSAVAGAHAADDPDGDGFSNLTEFLLGSDPKDPLSNLRITGFDGAVLQWQAKPRELYEIRSSTNLVDWVRGVTPVLATNSVMSLSDLHRSAAHEFYRVVRVP